MEAVTTQEDLNLLPYLNEAIERIRYLYRVGRIQIEPEKWTPLCHNFELHAFPTQAGGVVNSLLVRVKSRSRTVNAECVLSVYVEAHTFNTSSSVTFNASSSVGRIWQLNTKVIDLVHTLRSEMVLDDLANLNALNALDDLANLVN